MNSRYNQVACLDVQIVYFTYNRKIKRSKKDENESNILFWVFYERNDISQIMKPYLDRISREQLTQQHIEIQCCIILEMCNKKLVPKQSTIFINRYLAH